MKGFKEAKIIDYRIWVDGKEIKDKKDVPEKGKVVFCKMWGEMQVNDSWYDFTSTGRANCSEDDEFDYEQGRDIAFARAKKDFILKCMEKLNKLSEKICDHYEKAGNVLDYANYELMAMGAKKQPDDEEVEDLELYEKISRQVDCFAGYDIDRIGKECFDPGNSKLMDRNFVAYVLGKLLITLEDMSQEDVNTLVSTLNSVLYILEKK